MTLAYGLYAENVIGRMDNNLKRFSHDVQEEDDRSPYRPPRSALLGRLGRAVHAEPTTLQADTGQATDAMRTVLASTSLEWNSLRHAV